MSHTLPTHRAARRGRRGLSAISLVLAAAMPAALVAGCGASSGGGGATAAAKSGGQLVWGKHAETALLDPTLSGDGRTWETLHLVYEGLVGLDDNLEPVPELAESWKQTSPTTYVFDLRKGVKFSNGREMTTDDVVGTLDRVMDPKVAAYWAGQLGIKETEATGPGQVTVTLAEPKSSFLAALAGTPAKILPMRELAAKTFDPKKDLLGTGPFKVTAHSPEESWTFDRNPHYWRPGLPKVNRVVVRIMPDVAARTAALRDGSIDVTTFDSPDSLRLLKGQGDVKTVVQTTTDYYRLDVNAKSSVFRDDRLRQALALSIERDKIKDLALAGVGSPSAAVPPAFGVCDPAAVPFGTPDVAKARELVTAAGAAGRPVEINALQIFPVSPAIAQVLQQNLQAAGLKVRITTLEPGESVKRVWNGKTADFDLTIAMYAGYADPAMVLPWWNPELAKFNKAYEEPDAGLNELIDTSMATAPGPERTRAMRAACTRIAQNANVIPLVSKEAIVAYRGDRVSALIPRVEGYAVPLRRLAEFTVK